jgi:arylsulfatase A-like enzyme
VFVLTDDLDTAELRYMPHTLALIARRGATFDRYFVSNSLCCPSRVTMLRGQYAHNTGVWSNGGNNGGFERAFASGIESDTVATRLHRAGYLTSLTGKYLNGYPSGAPPDYVPAGWSNWASPVYGSPYSEYRYVLNQNGAFLPHRTLPSDYGTDVYVRLTNRFIRRAVSKKRPFFAFLSVYAPHQPAVPALQDLVKFPLARAPRTASFDQADVSHMPKFVRDLPAFSTTETTAIDDLYRLRIRSLQAVDRGVAALVHTLRATGRLDDTYFVFASDNGFHLGQHRMPAGKQTAYDTDIRVPLLVRGPGVSAGMHVAQLAGNVDLAPTFEAMTGVRPAPFTDGRSLLPILHGTRPAHWRNGYLVEHRNETGVTPPARPEAERPTPLEPSDPDQAARPGERHQREIRDSRYLARRAEIPDYDAVRTARYLYVGYATGERELYDLRTDPDEINNLTGQKPAVERVLAARVEELRQCRAAGCRAAEGRPVS